MTRELPGMRYDSQRRKVRDMKRAGRWLFNLVAAVALVMCVAIVGLWVHKQYYVVGSTFYSRSSGVILWTCSGEAIIDLLRPMPESARYQFSSSNREWFMFPPDSPWESFETAHPRPNPGMAAQEFLGLGIGYPTGSRWHERNSKGWDVTHRVVFPLWFAVLLSAILPFGWLKVFSRRRKRERKGLCLICGYDLRATPERCPECGTVSTEAKEALT